MTIKHSQFDIILDESRIKLYHVGTNEQVTHLYNIVTGGHWRSLEVIGGLWRSNNRVADGCSRLSGSTEATVSITQRDRGPAVIDPCIHRPCAPFHRLEITSLPSTVQVHLCRSQRWKCGLTRQIRCLEGTSGRWSAAGSLCEHVGPFDGGWHVFSSHHVLGSLDFCALGLCGCRCGSHRGRWDVPFCVVSRISCVGE